MAQKLTAKMVIADLSNVSDPEKASFMLRYFKTGKGHYGEGDIFIGITVPDNRIVAHRYIELPLAEAQKLLRSKIHEHRFCALLILGFKYQKHEEERKEIFEMYLQNTKYINNWDLVDTSAAIIIGQYIWNYFTPAKRKAFLTTLAKSKMLWERRIAMVSTYYGIQNGKLDETFFTTATLLKDREDLIHKAAGWMLREAGKKDKAALMHFLGKYGAVMPRTMLRYSIERFNPAERALYLQIKTQESGK